MNYLPAKLLKLRKHYNYSQQYLAEVLDVETLEYMSYENGNKIINYEQMKKLASLYHIEMSDMFKNSDDVPLYEIVKANTDEINIAYFIPEKSTFEKLKEFIVSHKLVTGIIVVLLAIIVILGSILGNKTDNEPHIVQKENIDRLSVSQTTVVYISDIGSVKYTGDNSNHQMDADSSTAVKVKEGEGFTAILNEDGTVTTSGISRYEKEISSWSYIRDIAAGKNHLVGLDSFGKVYCVGDNSYGQCDISGTKNIKKIFTTANGTICMDNDGNISYSGTFIGSSNIISYSNIIDVDSSEDILTILENDGTLVVYAKDNSNYLLAESWSDIVDVACGNDFVAGLDSFGRVHIEIENETIEKEVNSWANIIAIDAGNNYLIGFDGKRIYGVGKNSYGQFTTSEVEKIELQQVSNVEVTTEEDFIYISFSPVDNAEGYTITIDVETGIEVYLDASEPTITAIKTANMIDGKSYNIYITSKGGNEYKDSTPYKYRFTYEAIEELLGEDNE